MAVVIKKDGKVLLGKRKSAHGIGAWGFPGGHLEFGESWEVCAQREVFEETGLKIDTVTFGCATNDIFKETDKHYVTIFVETNIQTGNPQLCEPDRCEEWAWFSWDSLPTNLFLPITHALENGYNPFAIFY